LTIGAGLTWTNNEDMVLDVLVNFGNAGGSSTLTTSPTISSKLEWDSKTAFEIAGRLFYDWKDNITLVPVIDYTSSEYSQTLTTADPERPEDDRLLDRPRPQHGCQPGQHVGVRAGVGEPEH
jgi:hypothetical protein